MLRQRFRSWNVSIEVAPGIRSANDVNDATASRNRRADPGFTTTDEAKPRPSRRPRFS
jgi:hypothetical protein